LKKFAHDFIKTRLDSLKKDVDHCLAGTLAPFPALLYCFSTIDMLGSFYSGNALGRTNSADSIKYMEDFMLYTNDQASMLMNVFRHKLVHLAQPNPISNKDGKNIGWQYEHFNPQLHLKMTVSDRPAKLLLAEKWNIQVDAFFNVTISQLVEDIHYSVNRNGGYLYKLETEEEVRDKFSSAIFQIYSP
jgi:hypothetical protein